LHTCPSFKELRDFHGGTLADAALDEVADHLESCPNCRAALAKLDGQTDSFLAALRCNHGAPPPASPSAEAPLPQLPGYDVLGLLGAGGMGTVYKARHLRLGRIVALKVMKPGRPGALARFKAEAEAAARLQHPNIVQIFDVGEHKGKPYLALEFVEGGSLEKWLQTTQRPPGASAAIVELLARAVHYAHERGIVHRDLKPGNILLQMGNVEWATQNADRTFAGLPAGGSSTSDSIPSPAVPVPKITDFGLAKLLDAEIGQTQTGEVMGTPAYMSPEQAQGRKDVGPPADVWALGAILYVSLTRQHPFQGQTHVSVLDRVCHHDPIPPRRLAPRTPVDLETICLKCLEKDPARRYSSAQALADDLERYREGRPIQARPAGTLGRVVKWGRRYPVVAGLMALVLVIAASAFGLVTWQWREALYQKGLADQRADQAQAAKADAEAEKDNALVQLHRSSLGQYAFQIAAAQAEIRGGHFARARKILAGCDERYRGWEHGHLTAASQDRSRDLGPFADGAYGLAFDPTGRFLAIGAQDGQVRVWDAKNNKLALAFQGGPGAMPVVGVAFSPDGKTLATAGRDGVARTWNALTGKLKGTFTGNGAPWIGAWIAFSPDGTRLIASGTEALERWADVFAWEVATGRQLSARRRQRNKPDFVESLDGLRQATAEANRIRVRDAKGRPTHSLPAAGITLSDLTFSRDGKRLAGRGSDQTLRVWDVDKEMQIASFALQNIRILTFVFSADGNQLVGGALSLGGAVKVWDVASGAEVVALRGHDGVVAEVAMSPDGLQLASSDHRGGVKLWNLHPAKALTLLPYGDRVAGLAFSPDSRRLATISAFGNLRLWSSLRTGPVSVDLAAGQGVNPVPHDVAFGLDGRVIATAGPSGVKVRDARLGEARLLFSDKAAATSVAYSPDGKFLAWAGQDGRVRLCETGEGQLPREFGKEAKGALRVAFSPNGRLLACGCANGKVHVWDVVTEKQTAILTGHDGAVTSVAFAPLRHKTPHHLAESKLLLDPAAVVLASAGADGTARLWDLSKNKETFTLRGHSGAVNALSFNPDGRRLATAGIDQSVQLWDVPTGLPVCVLQGHVRPIHAVQFSPDGQHLATAGEDRAIHLWHGADTR
jgi:WD40 repeat protein